MPPAEEEEEEESETTQVQKRGETFCITGAKKLDSARTRNELEEEEEEKTGLFCALEGKRRRRIERRSWRENFASFLFPLSPGVGSLEEGSFLIRWKSETFAIHVGGEGELF